MTDLTLADAARRDRNTLYCSFCDHSQHEVGLLIIGSRPGAGICDRCVELAADMLVEHREAALEEIRRLGT